jgi:TolB protein
MKNDYLSLLIFIVTFSLALSSCGGISTPLPSPTPNPTFTPSSTPNPSPTYTPSPTPTPILPTGLISFDSNREGAWGIYVINADGTGKVNLVTLSPGNGDEYSAWSPDGQKIAFHSYRSGTTSDIFTINADSTGLSRLTNNPAYEKKPTWSPDGKQIAFLSSENGDPPFEIYLMNVDGSGLKRLTGNVQGMTSPSWSPDGSRIAFDSYSGDNLEVFVINADRSNLVQLTRNSASGEPTWSPDGERIAFVSARNGGAEIYVMNADGSGVKQITKNSTSYEPAWSPDGNFITFTSERSGNPEIYIMKANGGDVIQLTDDPADDYAPRWAPEGVTLGSEPWFGPPFCSLDTDGDFQPDTATMAFNSHEIGYIMFPYRNMTDGMMFGHQWTLATSEFNQKFMSFWDGGSSGWHTSYAFLSSGAGEVSIQLFIEDRVVQEIVCEVVEP